MNIFCYQHHISDFRRDTADLTCEQRGVYRDLLDAYYFGGGHLTSDPEKLARIVSVHSDGERSALAHAISIFFTIRDGFLRHKRADEEIRKIRDKSIKAKASAKSKYVEEKEKEPSVRSTNAIPNDELTKNQEPYSKSPLGLFESPPTPSEEKTNVKSRRKSRAASSFITENFRPDIGAINLAAELKVDAESTCTEFIDYWKSAGKPMSDWQAAFRNRLRQIAKYRAERAARPIDGRSGAQSVAGAALRVAARYSGIG